MRALLRGFLTCQACGFVMEVDKAPDDDGRLVMMCQNGGCTAMTNDDGSRKLFEIPYVELIPYVPTNV